MINEHIAGADAVFFLGAGASNPLAGDRLGLPLMHDFVERIAGRPPFNGSSLFKSIIARDHDLEFLYQELEDWGSKGYFGPSRVVQQVPGIRGGPPAFIPEDECRTWLAQRAREATQMWQALRKEVFDTYQAVDEKKVERFLREVLWKAIGRPDHGGRPLVVFTTNYDPAVETLCRKESDIFRLVDGFVQPNAAADLVWDRGAFDQLDPGRTPPHTVALFKLHGSTNWYAEGGTIFKSRLHSFMESGPRYRNLLLYPARRKVATDEPFFTLYDYFQRVLGTGKKLCIVIGYSFRDEDLLARLRSAARHNRDLRLLVIDKEAASICSMLRKQGIAADPVAAQFGNEPHQDTYLERIAEAFRAR